MSFLKNYVFAFNEVKKGNSEEMQFLLGNKGAQLAEMTSSKLPVPPGFTITTEACKEFYSSNKKWPSGLEEQVKKAMKKLEAKMKKKFGDEKNPLLVSVRSGSYVSMPGMMETILNLGLNDKTVQGLAAKTKNKRMAFDSYRRFITMFGDVVLDVKHSDFEKILDNAKETKGVKFDTELNAEDLEALIPKYKKLVRDSIGKDFPQEVWEQLRLAISAVFDSWNGARAIAYRNINHLRHDAGTGVNVQSMVFGNMGESSGTGVSFTRNPANGKKEHYGEFLVNAQGEDVVAGIRTPMQIDGMKKLWPKVYADLIKVYEKLELHYRDMQDFEFTIEEGKLFLLQTRSGKRTAHAAVKIAVDMHNEKLISKEEAVLRVKPEQLDKLLHKQLDPLAVKEKKSIAKGINASPGAAVGKAVFTAEKAKELFEQNPKEKLVLVRLETSPEDIEGMHVAQGILTARGGATCLAGDTTVLTDNGFFSCKELFDAIEQGLKPKILSFDSSAMKTVWKPIIAAGKREAEAIEINVSQSSRTKNNSLVITPEHKMMILENRSLIKKPLENVLSANQMVSIIDKIPLQGSLHDPNYAFLVGAILTDGCLQLSRRRGRTVFTQKGTSEKHDFISKVNLLFFEKFGVQMKERVKNSVSNYQGREIRGSAFDYVCSQKAPTAVLLETRSNLVNWVLDLDEQSTLNFLAGAIDGDGSFGNNRLHIYVGNENLLQGIVISCLKLGIVPQVTTNRTIWHVQLVEKMQEICSYTARVKPKIRGNKYESKLFSTRQLFEDVKQEIDFTGRIKPAIRDNKMLGKVKIMKYVFKPRLREQLKTEIAKVLDSDLRMYRAQKTADAGTIEVYNFEVDSSNELDKNFVVFSKKMTPILVSNSHAAVVARGMGKPCVSGASDINVDEQKKEFSNNSGVVIKEGDWLSLDGGTGEVFEGQIPLVEPTMHGDFSVLMNWADSFRKLKIKTNADTPKDAEVAKNFGAEGIGLCRTEHLFFEGERIKAMRKMIVAETLAEREKALAELLPFQKEDFKGLFKVMDNLPVIIRFLDPPLHEFLPKEEKEIKEIAGELGISEQKLKNIIASLHEFNPMLGFRGCRLGVQYPEITSMQAKAIFLAALENQKEGLKPVPWIEIPIVGNIKEFLLQKELVEKEAVATGAKGKVNYKIGTMIEVPRACMVADVLAKEADFFSFGTNDLTQMSCGFSRDDAGKFLKKYVEIGIYERDPFQSIDQEGVGGFMKMAIEKARSVKPHLEIGICGEHGGEPASVEFCHRIGLNDVSCSPYRVPIARLAAAQAAIKEKTSQGKASGKAKKKTAKKK